jgi:hypothetical protein
MKQLVIEIGAPANDQFPVRFYDLDAGNNIATGSFKKLAPDIAALQTILTKSPKEVDDAGVTLFSWLETALGAPFLTEIESKTQHRLLLDIRHKDLYALPWEILAWNRTTPLGAVFARVREQHHLSRSFGSLVAAATKPTPIRVLVLIGCDDNDKNVQPDDELTEIYDGLQASHGAVDLRVVRRPTDLNDLYTHIVPYRPHVLHFIGHGDDNPPSLRAAPAWTWKPAELADLGKPIVENWCPRLVFLNACRTAKSSSIASVAGAFLVNGANAVIAMQGDIKGTAAGQLAGTFYKAIADGEPLDAALSLARTVVARSYGPREASYPALTMQTHPASVLPTIILPLAFIQHAPKKCPFLPKLAAFVNQSSTRQELLSKLWPPRDNDPATPFLMLVGNSGYGKTLLSVWLLKLAAYVGNHIRYVRLQPDGAMSLDSISILQRIWDGGVTNSPLTQALPLDPNRQLKLAEALQNVRDTSAVYERFRTAMRTLASTNPVTIVLDDFGGCMDEGSFTEFWNKFIAYPVPKNSPTSPSCSPSRRKNAPTTSPTTASTCLSRTPSFSISSQSRISTAPSVTISVTASPPPLTPTCIWPWCSATPPNGLLCTSASLRSVSPSLNRELVRDAS